MAAHHEKLIAGEADYDCDEVDMQGRPSPLHTGSQKKQERVPDLEDRAAVLFLDAADSMIREAINRA